MKPHDGTIYQWRKIPSGAQPGSLGYRIAGIPQGHPEFTNWIITSEVLKREGNEIETLNSRYTLFSEYVSKYSATAEPPQR
jgi:hypothetical protein